METDERATVDQPDSNASPAIASAPLLPLIGAFILIVSCAGLLAAWPFLIGSASKSKPNPPLADRNTSGRANPTSALDFAGSRACAECHPGESAFHAKHGHSQTLRRMQDWPLKDWLVEQTAQDSEFQGATWTYAKPTDTRALIAYLNLEGSVTSQRLDFAFGSGGHASTFVSLSQTANGHEALEHRMTYYKHGHHLGITPGQHMEGGDARDTAMPSGRSLNVNSTRRCFRCHATRLSAQDQAVLDPETLMPSVGCEVCHGPGRVHIEAAKRDPLAEFSERSAMPWGSAYDRTPDEEMILCGQCHRHPIMAPKGAIRTDNPDMNRFQPAALMQSLCYKRGQARCVTCHDPHEKPTNDRAFYNNRCLSCHQGAAKTHCSAQPTPSDGCIDCHMPRKDAGQGILFADHWIRKLDLDPVEANAGPVNPNQNGRPEPTANHDHD